VIIILQRAKAQKMGHNSELHLVTGGGGYPGFRLAMALLKRGHRVRLLDLHPLRDVLPEGVTFIQVSITHKQIKKVAKTN